MSGTYITLINSTLARLNEVQLTTGTFVMLGVYKLKLKMP